MQWQEQGNDEGMMKQGLLPSQGMQEASKPEKAREKILLKSLQK